MFSFAAVHMYGAYLKVLVLNKFTDTIHLKKPFHLHHQCVQLNQLFLVYITASYL